MKNFLVTGGAGFIGSNFIHYLQSVKPESKIVNLDVLTYAGSEENLKGLPAPERHVFVKGDIADRGLIDNLLKSYDIDTIVHFAAESHVDRSILGPELFVRTNILGTFTLLEAAKQYWLKSSTRTYDQVRFHHISTDEVYGTLAPDEPAWTEKVAYAPNSPYSASKASSDHLVRAYYHTYGLPVTITNCTNNYGPRQFPEKLIPLMILNAMEGKPLPIYGDGQQIRDWLFVRDHCDAIYRVLLKGRVGETYNIGGNNQPANLDIVKTLCNILDECLPESEFVPHEQLITYVKDRPGHDRRYAIDISKINKELGWSPQQDLQSGLEITIDWYLANTDWVVAIRKQTEYQKWLLDNYLKRGGDEE